VGYLFDISVQWSIDSETAGAVTPEGSSTTFTAGILLNSGFCTITATYGGFSGSTGMPSINAYMDKTAPDTPAKPVLITKGEDMAEFSWNPNTEEDLEKYVVQRAEKPEGPWKKVATLDPEETSYKDRNLDPGKTYYFRVIAYDEAGNPSAASESMEIETEEPAGFFDEFLWLLIILIIVVVVIIAAAIAAKGRKKKTQPPQAAAQPQPQRTTLPPPPKKKTSPKPKTVEKKPVEKPEPSKPLPPPPEKEMPPPPPPPPEP
jgi:hypothetical protein